MYFAFELQKKASKVIFGKVLYTDKFQEKDDTF